MRKRIAAVKWNKRTSGDRTTLGILTNGNFIDAALSRGHASTLLKDVMLRPANRRGLEALIRRNSASALLTDIERHQAAEQVALRRIARLRQELYCSSGCKRAGAATLHCPIRRGDRCISRSDSGTHLRELFRFAADNPCVLLFDEIDALGKQRGNPLDVGELDRIVIALMQELEFLETQGIVIATSNLPENLEQSVVASFRPNFAFSTAE